jgi:hypothetical protein
VAEKALCDPKVDEFKKELVKVRNAIRAFGKKYKLEGFDQKFLDKSASVLNKRKKKS